MLYDELYAYIDRVKNPYLNRLLHAFFDEAGFREMFKRAPAAKGFHHNSLGGLLEHTLSVTKLLDFILGHYPALKRDLVLAGGSSMTSARYTSFPMKAWWIIPTRGA